MKILYQDKDLLVVDKPAGISVHTGNTKTPVKVVADLLGNKINDPDPVRPGIVHRLDKDTSGVLIVARSIFTKKYLQQQFKDRTVKKVYEALVYGVPNSRSANIDLPIGRHSKNPLKRAVKSSGKLSLTTYRLKKVIQSKQDKKTYSLLEVSPQTGRTHQIRVHLSYLGHPIVGDSVYGAKTQPLTRLWLHAKELTLKLPDGQVKTFKSPLPPELANFVKSL